MKTLILLLLSLTSLKTQAQNLTKCDPELAVVKGSIERLQPSYVGQDLNTIQLARSILKHSRVNNVDWKLLVSIFYQESSLRVDPQGCAKSAKKCTGDYGIGQVNYRTWGKKLKINKSLMLTSADYAISKAVEVLAHYKAKYGKRELDWYTRYHSNTPKFRRRYMKNLNNAFRRLNNHLDVSRLIPGILPAQMCYNSTI